MSGLSQARIAVGAAALVATLYVGVKLLLSPLPIDPPASAVEFPHDPALPGWRSVAEAPDPVRPRTQRYERSEPALELEMQFIPNLAEHYVRNPEIELRFLARAHLPLDAGLRFYVSPRAKVIPNHRSGRPGDSTVTPGPAGTGYWTVDGTANLSTIITPEGRASIIPLEVARSLYLHPLTSERIARWLFAREPLPDPRCVLMHFSTADGPQARAALEQAWNDWRGADFPVFPTAAR